MLWECVYLLGFPLVYGFNVAPEGSLVASHTPDSYFGYTVALQTNPPRLIIGAPRSFSSLPQHAGLHQPGAVFSIAIKGNSSNVQLQEIVQFTLEEAGEELHREEEYWDRKEEAWIGGSLDVADNEQSLVTCGPRWKNQIHEGYYLMNGVCYSLPDSRSPTRDADKLIPLLERNKQQTRNNLTGNEYFYYSYGQAGFSVHLTPQRQLLIGAPGVLQWLGSVIMYEQIADGTYRNLKVPNPLFTSKKLNYLGYAVSSGIFLPQKRLYAASAPRSSYRGKVILFEFPSIEDASLDIQAELEGSQMGEYFGASICVADVNGDGLDDILVSAPLYASKDSHDAGLVYVYLNSIIWNEGGRVSPTQLKGHSLPGARFGSAVASVGDLDMDGYIDVAVGAPYEKHGESSGSIYIYRGSSKGVIETPSQVIKASELKTTLRGFGISISRGLDVDSNHYPDFAVGAYESGHAVVLRSKPVVHISTKMERSITTIYSNTSQFIIDVCISYQGVFLPKYPLLVANVIVLVDRLHRRATIDPSGNVPVPLKATTSNCRSFIVRLTQSPSIWAPHIRYASLPIVVKSSLPSPCPTCPTLDPASNTSLVSKIPVMGLCDKDECVPEWRLSTHFLDTQNPFVIGSADSVTARILVSNDGDNARLMLLNVSIPTDIRLRTIPSVCEGTEYLNSYYCFSGIRIDHGEQILLDVVLDVRSLNSSTISVNFLAHSYDTNSTVDVGATVNSIRVPEISLSGRALPDLLVLRDASPHSIIHSYQAFCSGFTPVSGARIAITVPSRVYAKNSWLQIGTFSTKAMFGEIEINCTDSSAAAPYMIQPSSLEARAHISCGTPEIECTVVDCEVSQIFFPRAEGLTVDLKILINGDALTALLNLEESHVVELSTLAEVYIEDGAAPPPVKSLTTTLAGSIPERSDPYLWVYILVAVIIAIILLASLVCLLKKCGFFERWKRPDGEDASRLYSETEENKS